MKLDARDIAILRVLSREGRISQAALAERVGLSPNPCWQRLRKLERAGLIEGCQAEIALRKPGPHVTVFVAGELANHTAASFRAFEAAVARQDEIADKRLVRGFIGGRWKQSGLGRQRSRLGMRSSVKSSTSVGIWPDQPA
jgi:DNA-binding Lrp family transcriptional regulator